MKHKGENAISRCPLSRRDFIKTSALTAAALSINPKSIFADEPKFTFPAKSIVAVSENLKAITDDYKIDAKLVREMIDENLKAITNTKSANEGWLKIFPNLKEKEVIGLKVNTVNKRISAHPEVAYSIADSLADAGINKNKILIFDNIDRFLTDAGYTINTSDKGYKCYGTYHDKNIWLDPNAKIYLKSVDLERTYSRILTEHIDYLINIPVLKSADTAGVTLSLKNMYGVTSILDLTTLGYNVPNYAEIAMKMHDHNCNPQIAEINSFEHLMKKTKLVVLDALMGIYEGSAHVDPQGVNHKIVMSQDRVATDVTGFDIINARRKEKGMPEITKEKAGHIWSAEKMSIGNADPSKIELRKLNLKA